MKLSKLEPYGLTILAAGLLYSITVFIINNTNYKLHFIILTLIIFIALFFITSYKYLMFRYTTEKINNIILTMKAN